MATCDIESFHPSPMIRYDDAAHASACGDGFDGMRIDQEFRDCETLRWEDCGKRHGQLFDFLVRLPE